jgi:hypothetical protein
MENIIFYGRQTIITFYEHISIHLRINKMFEKYIPFVVSTKYSGVENASPSAINFNVVNPGNGHQNKTKCTSYTGQDI